MAFGKTTSYLTPDDEDEQDYLSPNAPAVPQYIAPPDYSTADLPATPQYVASKVNAPVSPVGASSPSSYIDDDTDPNRPLVGTPQSVLTRQELAELEKHRPQDKNPGFWRTLAGIGAGIGVGYLTRNPRMIASVQGQIMHPGAAKVQDWANQVSDKAAQAAAQEKTESDARANTMGDADLANKQADTGLALAKTHQLGLPDAATPPTPVTKNVVGPDGQVHIRYYPNPNDPTKYSELGTPPDAGGGPKNDIELRRDAYKREHNGQEPPSDVISTWLKPVEPPRGIDYWIQVKNDPKSTPDAVAQANQNIKDHTAVLQSQRPERPVNETAQKNQAINAAFMDSGNDWNKVLDNARAGKYQDYAAEIADHAAKMTTLKTDAQRKVTAADTTVQQAQDAINAIDEVTKAHPDLVGGMGNGHVLNALTRQWQTTMGTEPPDIGAVDAMLETVAALQPGQHNFRSVGALAEFKKALGIDPRTKKPDGSRAWLVNPEKAKAALKQIVEFNKTLKDNTINASGTRQPSATSHAPAAALSDPLGIR